MKYYVPVRAAPAVSVANGGHEIQAESKVTQQAAPAGSSP
ncbi:hypothetical protein KNP414_06891 [Paenibacillus mucilaginosus KNP414]|uniref:Uncharacterized protein n=1 Tax=Paenibacillus mucilaginosus (strain KNP414) TaxID=1036673 RepID=F8FGN2_PAEMK|nr:hypothetical protein KNP414_06891 [Paenibacillus mucilaginosus KNP414]